MKLIDYVELCLRFEIRTGKNWWNGYDRCRPLNLF